MLDRRWKPVSSDSDIIVTSWNVQSLSTRDKKLKLLCKIIKSHRKLAVLRDTRNIFGIRSRLPKNLTQNVLHLICIKCKRGSNKICFTYKKEKYSLHSKWQLNHFCLRTFQHWPLDLDNIDCEHTLFVGYWNIAINKKKLYIRVYLHENNTHNRAFVKDKMI